MADVGIPFDLFEDWRAELTYYKQAIPSPYGLPLYHEVTNVTALSFMQDHTTVPNNNSIDISGKAVDRLASNICLANAIYDIHRLFEADPDKLFHYQNVQSHEAMKQLGVFDHVAKCRESDRYGQRTFFSQCYKYQTRQALTWRPHPHKAEVIVPPLLPHDETTNAGAAKVILSMLRQVGILKCDGGDEDDPTKLHLADAY